MILVLWDWEPVGGGLLRCGAFFPKGLGIVWVDGLTSRRALAHCRLAVVFVGATLVWDDRFCGRCKRVHAGPRREKWLSFWDKRVMVRQVTTLSRLSPCPRAIKISNEDFIVTFLASSVIAHPNGSLHG
jgi:hypothetical protein